MATQKKTPVRTTKPKAPAAKAAAQSEALPRPEHFLKKRELLERAVAETGLKRRDVKAVTEAILATMGDALASGNGLALEPLGKLRVARVAERAASKTYTVKLRQKISSAVKTPEPAE